MEASGEVVEEVTREEEETASRSDDGYRRGAKTRGAWWRHQRATRVRPFTVINT